MFLIPLLIAALPLVLVYWLSVAVWLCKSAVAAFCILRDQPGRA